MLWPCLVSVIDCVVVGCFVGVFWLVLLGVARCWFMLRCLGLGLSFRACVVLAFGDALIVVLLFTGGLIVLITSIVLIGYYFGLYAGLGGCRLLGFGCCFPWLFGVVSLVGLLGIYLILCCLVWRVLV